MYHDYGLHPSPRCRLHLVDLALLEHLTRRCELAKHFTALKLFLLMEDGEFAHTLTSTLFEEVRGSMEMWVFVGDYYLLVPSTN